MHPNMMSKNKTERLISNFYETAKKEQANPVNCDIFYFHKTIAFVATKMEIKA
jgi:hypothetical protein